MRTYVKGIVIIITIGLVMSIGVFVKYKRDLEAARIYYIQEEHHKASEVASKIEHVFNTVYEGLRIITRLPGVKDIDRYAENFDLNARKAVQEIYNNIANNVELSEIYIVPLDFNPDKYDEYRGKREEPIIMFDELIVGRTALSDAEQRMDYSPKIPKVDEIEDYEYRLLVEQLAWMKENIPSEKMINGLNVPAISGPEVLTCDNTRFIPHQSGDRDRTGLVYSLPLYDNLGQLKGSISGVILSKVLEKYLPTENYILGNKKYDYSISKDKRISSHLSDSQQWIDQIWINPEQIFSEKFSLKISDAGNNWYLWARQDNTAFWQRQDVIMARQFAMLSLMGVIFVTASTILGFFISCRHNDHLETMNNDLQKHQSLLLKTQILLKRFSGAILSVREEEKKRLSRDIHDMVGSMAIGVNTKLKLMEDSIRSDNKQLALENTTVVKESVRKFVSSFKQLAMNLRPPQLDVSGFTGAVQEYCEGVAREHVLKIELDIEFDDKKLSDELSIALYRVVQEALSNIVKHSRATKVKISLFQKLEMIQLVISDNGIGFDIKKIFQDEGVFKMGLIGMHERMESFNGKVKIESNSQGTRILVTVPDQINQENTGDVGIES